MTDSSAQAGSSFDPDKFMAFVHGRTFESPRGPITIDKDNGDIIQNIYIRRTDKLDGVLQNVEIATMANEALQVAHRNSGRPANDRRS